MRVVFVSNYFNHHQKPLCEEIYKRLGDDFAFISTSVMREERRKLGYSMDNLPTYVHLSYESDQNYAEALAMINEADVVIAGAAPNKMLRKRIRQGKLLFRYSERPFKVEPSFARRLYNAIRFRNKDLWRKKNIYMLCASAYAATDFRSMGLYKNRMFKWGYFPEVKEYDIDALMNGKKRNKLLWCGRFLDWKHPDDAIMLAKRLKDAGYDFELDIIGTGVMEEQLHELVRQYDLADCVHFLGSMSPAQVRHHMEEAGIYLFTSDRKEGWGAVLNESMNSGCAVVASDAIGSVPFVVKNGSNGYIYESGNLDELFELTQKLLENHAVQIKAGEDAYRSVCELWCASTAVDRFFEIMAGLLSERKKMDMQTDVFDNGPLSKVFSK